MSVYETPSMPIQATPRSQGGIDNVHPEPAVRPLGIALVVVSIAFVAAGLVWPHAADALLRLLVVTIAVGFVAGRAYRAVEPVPQNLTSPFTARTVVRAPPAAPQALAELTLKLNPADRPRHRRQATIPSSTRQTIAKEAARRLAEHHGLNLGDPNHHDDIRSLVSEPAWHLIRPHGVEPLHVGSRAYRIKPVPLRELGRILDDLEKL